MADEYVPAGGWEAAGYGSYMPTPVNYGIQAQQNYYAPAATYQASAGNYAPQTQTQQALLPYQGSYSELRGWNPDPMAANNSGPAMTNFIQSDGIAARTGGSQLGGDYNDVFNAPFGSQNPGGDYNDQFNVPYNATGGAELMAGNPYQPSPYGDMSGVQFAQSSPYGDMSGVPRSPYGDLSGVPAMQPPSPYGTLQGADMQGWRDADTGNWMNPYGDLSGNRLDPMADFQGSYQPTPPLPPPRPASLETGGAGLYGAPPPIETGFQNPQQSYQTPTTPQTFGGLMPAFDAMSDRDMQGFDQTYMDVPQGSYGSLMGAGGDMPSTYETMGGVALGSPPQSIDTSFQNPTWPNVMPTSQDSAASSPPRPASQQFASAMGSTYGAATPSPDFGNLNLNFQPMPGTSGTKIADRAPQLGGFVSYSAPQLPAPSQPMQAITKALSPNDGGNWGDWWQQSDAFKFGH